MDERNSEYLRWTDIAYAGEVHPPSNPEEPRAGSWKVYFIKHDENGEGFETLDGHPINFEILEPEQIDWLLQLRVVKRVLNHLTEKQKTIATYWGEGPPTKQWTPIADRLIDTYGVPAPRTGRILGALYAAINDTFVVTWYLKYKWLVARPNQYDQTLATYLCTPRHPTYPSGHASVAGVSEVILSYFFPAEKRRLHELAEECAKSRLYGGVHFPVDNDEGLRLGRQIGRLVVQELKQDVDGEGNVVDIAYRNFRNAKLNPPPYEQVIPFDYHPSCQSLLLSDVEESRKLNKDVPNPKLYF